MSYSPISGDVPQYQKDADGTAASGFYLKFFAENGTTPILMATDITGGTLLSVAQINTTGNPRTAAGDTSTFIPHINQNYKIGLFPTLDDADNVTNAIWLPDNVPQMATFDDFDGAITDLTLDLANSADPFKGSGQVGHLLAGLAGVTDFESEVSTEINRLSNRAVSVTDPRFGAVGDGITDDTVAIQAAFDAGDYVLARGGPYRITDQITLTRHVIVEGDRYDFSLPAADCTFLCDFNDTAKSLFRTEGGFHLQLRSIAIDMDQNATRAITSASSGIVTTKSILIERFDATATTPCVVLESGANHFDSFIIGATPTDIENGAGITAGCIAIDVQGSDNMVSNGEVKIGFDIGIKEDGSNNKFLNNNSDQCNTGGLFLGTNTQILGNRFSKNYVVGLQLGDNAGANALLNPTVMGNVCSDNNLLRSASAGNYSGPQIICDNVTAGVISGNVVTAGLTGIVLNRLNNTTVGVNTFNDLDGDDIDLAGDATNSGRSQLHLAKGIQSINPVVIAGPLTVWAIESEIELQGPNLNLKAGGVKQAVVTETSANLCDSASTLSFFEGSGAVKQTGVGVDAASIHAALVAYGIISA